MTAIVTRGNAADLHLPDETVDLIVTSPPYFGLRSYQDGGEHYAGQIGDEATPAEYLDALIACTAEWMRVLKPGGSIFVNLGDKYAGQGGGPQGASSSRRGRSNVGEQHRGGRVGGAPAKSLIGLPWRYAIRCIDDLGLVLRAEVIWAKTNAMPESATDRVRREHEHLFHFTRSANYFASMDDVREPHVATLTKRSTEGWKPGPSGGNREPGSKHFGSPELRHFALNAAGKAPGSVWNIATTPLVAPTELGVEHFAAYPAELVRRCVLGWSPEGGTVLDPFGGTGTTALVASCYGRVGISVDLSADYCRLARWRTTDPGERARVLKVEKPPVQVDGQLGMFEGIGA